MGEVRCEEFAVCGWLDGVLWRGVEGTTAAGGGRTGERGEVHFSDELLLGFGTEVAVHGGLDLEEGLDDGF